MKHDTLVQMIKTNQVTILANPSNQSIDFRLGHGKVWIIAGYNDDQQVIVVIGDKVKPCSVAVRLEDTSLLFWALCAVSREGWSFTGSFYLRDDCSNTEHYYNQLIDASGV